jgi:hypothetical protein
VPAHAARLAPLRPETVWTLTDDSLIESGGKREHRHALKGLRTLRFAGLPGSPRHAVVLQFAKGRCVIASHSWRGPGRFEDRTDTYSPFVRALIEQAADLAPRARFATAGLEVGEAFLWTIGLLGLGAVVLLVTSISAGAASLGVALAARLVFVLILMLAALPWFRGRTATIDPRSLPRDLLP